MLSSHDKLRLRRETKYQILPIQLESAASFACFRLATFDSHLIKRYDQETSGMITSSYKQQVDEDVLGNNYYMNATAGHVFNEGDFRSQKHR